MAYNSLITPGAGLERDEIQFSHAEDRAHEYHVHDKVVWPNERHTWADGEVHVPGIGRDLNGVSRYFDILIVGDEIREFHEVAESDWERLDRQYRETSRTRLN